MKSLRAAWIVAHWNVTVKRSVRKAVRTWGKDIGLSAPPTPTLLNQYREVKQNLEQR